MQNRLVEKKSRQLWKGVESWNLKSLSKQPEQAHKPLTKRQTLSAQEARLQNSH